MSDGADKTVVIAGFGPVGAACAIALRGRIGSEAKIIVIDGQTTKAPSDDPRMIAISEGSRTLLARLGAWDGAGTTSIKHIHVSQRAAFGRTVIDASDYGLSALGHVVPYPNLLAMVRAKVSRSDIEVRHTRIASVTSNTDGEHISCRDGSTLRADYLIHAEGGTFTEQAARRNSRDYGQHALTGFVTATHPIAHCAFERFTTDGPIALLPANFKGRAGYALVWCAKPDDTALHLAMADAKLLAALHGQFGGRVGRFTSIEKRASFALGLHRNADPTKEREFAIGNAAQTLHPVAGQGFNLGLRDAMVLADSIGQHFAQAHTVRRLFLAARQRDRARTTGVTDFLPRAFALAGLPARHARGAALFLLDLIPAVRAPLARQMMNGQR